MKFRAFTILFASIITVTASGQTLLSGNPMGSTPYVDYSKDGYPPTYTVNTPADAFDGDFSTCYASYERSYTWVGLDLGTPHVISRVGFSPRDDWHGCQRLQLGVFEGANSPDFMDAIPFYIIPDSSAPIGEMTYADVDCSRGFRYVRYVGPSDARCNISELRFYGTEGEGDDSRLYQLTNIPTVVIHTTEKNEPTGKEKADELTSRIMIISDNGTRLLDATGTTRLRGNASMSFPKKPYRIKFDKKQKVLDAPAKAKKWTLINNYGDKTLLRNDIAFEVARRLDMTYVPYLQSVDVVLNGEYKGNYQLCDQVEVNDGRVEIEEMEPGDIEGDPLTGGYFIEIDAYANQEKSWFTSTRGIPVTIKSPDEDDITPEQSSYIRKYFNTMESKIWTAASSGYESFHSMFDIDSFLRHFLVGEISGNTDTYWSVYMYKHRGNPSFYTGPVWDFDLAFENDNRTYPVNNHSGYLYNSSQASAASGVRNFVNRILNNDPDAKPTIRYIWEYAAANRDLTAESLNSYVDMRASAIDASQRLNFLRWDIMNATVHQNPVIEGSYAGEVARVKKYITARFPHLYNIISRYELLNGVDDITVERGRILAFGNEVAAVGFGSDSRYTVTDLLGRTLSTGIFSGEHTFDLPVSTVVIITVVDGDTGTSVTRKFTI
ncbi:MAG: CotH kinase family protein [Muribaculaceae bacterium]|nr:CotH kinase family protein [Muribaculaceae bacterium]